MTGLEQLEAQKQSLLARVEGWPASRLNLRPSDGGWSASEVFDHLVKTEEGILRIAKGGLTRPRRVGITDCVRTLFLRKVFESERRVKVPASAAQVLPDAAPEMSVLLRRWQAVREDLASFHGQLTKDQMRHGLFRHPVGGWMALPDVVEFFSVHMQHHSFQLIRLSEETKNL